MCTGCNTSDHGWPECPTNLGKQRERKNDLLNKRSANGRHVGGLGRRSGGGGAFNVHRLAPKHPTYGDGAGGGVGGGEVEPKDGEEEEDEEEKEEGEVRDEAGGGVGGHRGHDRHYRNTGAAGSDATHAASTYGDGSGSRSGGGGSGGRAKLSTPVVASGGDASNGGRGEGACDGDGGGVGSACLSAPAVVSGSNGHSGDSGDVGGGGGLERAQPYAPAAALAGGGGGDGSQGSDNEIAVSLTPPPSSVGTDLIITPLPGASRPLSALLLSGLSGLPPSAPPTVVLDLLPPSSSHPATAASAQGAAKTKTGSWMYRDPSGTVQGEGRSILAQAAPTRRCKGCLQPHLPL